MKIKWCDIICFKRKKWVKYSIIILTVYDIILKSTIGVHTLSFFKTPAPNFVYYFEFKHCICFLFQLQTWLWYVVYWQLPGIGDWYVTHLCWPSFSLSLEIWLVRNDSFFSFWLIIWIWQEKFQLLMITPHTSPCHLVITLFLVQPAKRFAIVHPFACPSFLFICWIDFMFLYYHVCPLQWTLHDIN